MQFNLRRILIASAAVLPLALAATWIVTGRSHPILEDKTAGGSATRAAEDEPDPPDGSRRTLRGHSDGIYTLALSPDGKLLASGGRDRTIKLWDLATGKEHSTLEGHEAMVL